MHSEVMIKPRPVEIASADRNITLLQYLPYDRYYDQTTVDLDLHEDKEIQGVIFFAPAMAIRQGYYRYFLDYLSSIGYLVYSFDYSGIDLSRHGSLKHSELTMEDWINDLQAAVDWVLSSYAETLSHLEFPTSSNLPLYYLCHSLGGQFFGFLSNQNRFDAMIGITSQNGYWRLYKNSTRYFFFWYLLVSPLTWFFGYFPSKKVGFGEDLPPKIMKRWKKWCTSRNYFFDDDSAHPQYEQYQGRILTLSFTDDPWATEEAVDDLYDHYNNADRDHWHLNPVDYDIEEIGHLGYFRPKCKVLWQKTSQWLQV